MPTSIELPKSPSPPTRTFPGSLVLYGRGKCGKTTALSLLPGCLILDIGGFEAEAVTALKLHITDMGHLRDVLQKIKLEGKPYRFIAIDTLSELERWCEISATIRYKNSTLGKSFMGQTILELPMGLGFGFLRDEIGNVIEECKRCIPADGAVILNCHLRDKFLDGITMAAAGNKEPSGRKDSIATSAVEIDLTGKVRSIVTTKSDAVAFLYRTQEGNLKISFQTQDESSCGTRYSELEGKVFDLIKRDAEGKLVADWTPIFPERKSVI